MTNHRLDGRLQLVADRHRRQVITHLRREENGSTTFDDLVDQLHSGGSSTGDDPPRDRDALAIELHHTHLPKLAAHGVVEYEHRGGTVRYQPDEQVETVLDSLADDAQLPNR